jgi:ATP-dependent phosphofructokinase / diphosphate-dependent phosphofructokinase
MTQYIGILTSGGDSPGLNAAIRGLGKAALGAFGMSVIGFRDGFRGVAQNQTMILEESLLSGILTVGGTILGTSRDKPHRMLMGDKYQDMTDVIASNYRRYHLDALVCLGGNGTQKNALRLKEQGLNIITLPKTIDNDVALTDVTLGFDTALHIATEAIDRLHSTAYSHHRIVVVEIMGHRTGWLALGAGIAGGADVILIPEIPYDLSRVVDAIRRRNRSGKRHSIIAVAEGAVNAAETTAPGDDKKKSDKKKTESKKSMTEGTDFDRDEAGKVLPLAKKLQELTGLEARVSILGHLQRGGIPTAADRLLGTRLGTACAEIIQKKVYGVMLAVRGEGTEPVPLEEVAGKTKFVPLDHCWIKCARRVGTCLGD